MNRYKNYRIINNNRSLAWHMMQKDACTARKQNSNFAKMHKIVRLRWQQFWQMMDQQFLDKYPAMATRLGYIEGITGIRKEQVVLGVVLLVVLYIITAYFASISSDFISLAYPLYCSIKAQESTSNEQKEIWLRYWIVHSSVVMTEYFAGRILSLIPAYYLLRIFFILWCMSPYAENGSHFVYYKVIQPFFLHHQEQVESAFSLATAEMTSLRKDVLGADKDYDVKED